MKEEIRYWQFCIIWRGKFDTKEKLDLIIDNCCGIPRSKEGAFHLGIEEYSTTYLVTVFSYDREKAERMALSGLEGYINGLYKGKHEKNL